jgi:hypothetical protein
MLQKHPREGKDKRIILAAAINPVLRPMNMSGDNFDYH